MNRTMGILVLVVLVLGVAIRWAADPPDMSRLEPGQLVVVAPTPAGAGESVAAGTVLEVVGDDWDDRDDGSPEGRRARPITLRFRSGGKTFEIERENLRPY